VTYPADPEALSDEEWARYLFFRDNPKGDLTERWVHTNGCRRWFNVVRNTVTSEFKR
jgi:sarcosine oxidase subunit delta